MMRLRNLSSRRRSHGIDGLALAIELLPDNFVEPKPSAEVLQC